MSLQFIEVTGPVDNSVGKSAWYHGGFTNEGMRQKVSCQQAYETIIICKVS